MKIYLASKSPRRAELLTQMGINFEVLTVDTPELSRLNESAEAFSTRVTQEKMDAAWEKIRQNRLSIMPVLCADTEVVLDTKILGKPKSYQDAFSMLRNYSGREHLVLTSVSVKYLDYQKTAMNTTTVSFDEISDDDIHRYLETGDYKDKSGSYGIQSYIGQFISRIDGCFYSVMGLPLNTTRLLLDDLKSNLQNQNSAVQVSQE